jgi:ribosomal protein L11 methyltransferase
VTAPAGRAVRVTVPAAEADLAADVLWQAGAAAIEERAGPGGGDVVLVAARGGDPAGDPAGAGDPGPLLAAVAGRWPAEAVAVDLDAALDAWRAFARPVRAGRLVVRPPWVDPGPGGAAGPDDVVVEIDPGRAFGSGSHPSTHLALTALDRLVAGGERVLDVGCGSGVLAVAALALGADSAVAVDVDPHALAATRANAQRNGVAGALTVSGIVGGTAEGAHDLVLANLLLPTQLALAPVVAGAVAPGGTLVVSGVLVGQRAPVVAAYGAAGLTPVTEADEDGWLALTLRAG